MSNKAIKPTLVESIEGTISLARRLIAKRWGIEEKMKLTQLVSRRSKQVSIVLSIIGALFGWLLTIILVGGLIASQTLYHNGKPVWVGGIILGYFSFALSWFAFRLIRRPLPAEGETMMPRWFLIATVAFFIGCFVLSIIGNIVQKI